VVWIEEIHHLFQILMIVHNVWSFDSGGSVAVGRGLGKLEVFCLESE
jgi:hypothetical protein